MQVPMNVFSPPYFPHSDGQKRNLNAGLVLPVVSNDRRSEQSRQPSLMSCNRKAIPSSADEADFNCDELYKEFRPLVCRLVHQYGDSPEFRRDLEGEIYCRFRRLLDAFDPSRGIPLRPYIVRQLTASIHTLARKQWRCRSREASLQVLEHFVDSRYSENPTPDWDNAIELRRFKCSLPAAIDKLPERQRKVLMMRYYADKSFDEIAASLGARPATARSLLRHALNRLRTAMTASALNS